MWIKRLHTLINIFSFIPAEWRGSFMYISSPITIIQMYVICWALCIIYSKPVIKIAKFSILGERLMNCCKRTYCFKEKGGNNWSDLCGIPQWTGVQPDGLVTRPLVCFSGLQLRHEIDCMIWKKREIYWFNFSLIILAHRAAKSGITTDWLSTEKNNFRHIYSSVTWFILL